MLDVFRPTGGRRKRVATSFCPSCGEENPDDAAICGSCGVAMDADRRAETRRAPPLRWAAIGVCVALIAVPVTLTQLVPPLRFLAFRAVPETHVEGAVPFSDREADVLRRMAARAGRSVEEELSSLGGAKLVRSPVARGGMSRVLWPALFFFAGGAGAALLFRRRLGREAAIAGGLACAVHVALWVQALGWKPSLLFGRSLYAVSTQTVQQMPAAFFLMVLVVLFWAATVAGATSAARVREWVTRKGTCVDCGRDFPARPLPLACPSCHAPIQRSRVGWGYVLAGVAGTVALFSMMLVLLGPALRFYDRCAPDEPTPCCKAAIKDLGTRRQVESSSWRLYATRADPEHDRKVEAVVMHTWRYALWLSLAFIPAPLLLAWRLPRGGLASAGVSILLGWLAATATALIVFRLGAFEGAFVESLRLHLVYVIPWSIAGTAGAAIGNRLRGVGIKGEPVPAEPPAGLER
ncbi:MAG: zinc-ribbon domain-containing protein [Deltaproteobacteria bacterium]|nr:zinc-ribbon domain-containing protein [Deltaproteobacteria bacterium]